MSVKHFSISVAEVNEMSVIPLSAVMVLRSVGMQSSKAYLVLPRVEGAQRTANTCSSFFTLEKLALFAATF